LTDGASAGALRRGASGNRGPDLDLREATEKTRKLPHLWSWTPNARGFGRCGGSTMPWSLHQYGARRSWRLWRALAHQGCEAKRVSLPSRPAMWQALGFAALGGPRPSRRRRGAGSPSVSHHPDGRHAFASSECRQPRHVAIGMMVVVAPIGEHSLGSSPSTGFSWRESNSPKCVRKHRASNRSSSTSLPWCRTIGWRRSRT